MFSVEEGTKIKLSLSIIITIVGFLTAAAFAWGVTYWKVEMQGQSIEIINNKLDSINTNVSLIRGYLGQRLSDK